MKTDHTNQSSQKEQLAVATQWQLMWRKLVRHRLAIIGMFLLGMAYLLACFAGFFSTQDMQRRHTAYIYCPPQQIHFIDHNGTWHLRPFVYGFKSERHPATFERIYQEDHTRMIPIEIFVRGDRYKLWGLIDTDLHLFGVQRPDLLFLFGSDHLGRDIYSRTIYAARISLSIGLIGVTLSFILGCILGGVSGFYGGASDTIIQRVIEFLLSLPTIPLWMALAAAVPSDWPALQVYFTITIILSIVGWCGLARVVRGKLLSLRDEDYVIAARIAGATDARIIRRHLLPAFFSYLIVNLTLAIPGMILGETALSFLGLGLRAPIVSWGVLLNQAQDVKVVILYPWLLIPGLFVVVVVLAFNFLGDGLRDAADPYAT